MVFLVMIEFPSLSFNLMFLPNFLNNCLDFVQNWHQKALCCGFLLGCWRRKFKKAIWLHHQCKFIQLLLNPTPKILLKKRKHKTKCTAVTNYSIWFRFNRLIGWKKSAGRYIFKTLSFLFHFLFNCIAIKSTSQLLHLFLKLYDFI